MLNIEEKIKLIFSSSGGFSKKSSFREVLPTTLPISGAKS